MKIIDYNSRKLYTVDTLDGVVNDASIVFRDFQDNNPGLELKTYSYTMRNISIIENNRNGLPQGVATTIQFDNALSTDCAGDSVEAIVKISGGSGNYVDTSWIGIQPTFENGYYYLYGGSTYKIVVTDDNGCTGTYQTTVNSATPLVFDSLVYDDTLTCYGDTTGQLAIYARLKDTSATTFSYSLNGSAYQASNTFNNLRPGNNTILIRNDANGCTKDTVITLYNRNPISFTSLVDTNITCYNDNNGKIYVQAQGGQGTLTYLLLANDTVYRTETSGIFLNLPSDTFAIRAVDTAGCKSTDTSTIIINPDTIVIDSLDIIPESCPAGSDGQIIIYASGGTDSLLFSVDSGQNYQTDSIFTGLVKGYYNILVTDSNNCPTADSTVLVGPLPIIVDSLNVDTSLNCFGDTTRIEIYAHGGTGAFEYHLYSASDTIRQNDSVFSPVFAGNYTVRILDTNTGCYVDSNISVNQPNPILITGLSDTNITCNGLNNGKIYVQASGGEGTLTYALLANDTIYQSNATGIFLNLPADTFIIRAADTAGCISADTSSIIINPGKIVIDSLDITPETCPAGSNGQIVIYASGGTDSLLFSVDSGQNYQTDSIFTGLVQGYYNILVTDSNNCPTADSTILVGPLPINLDSLKVDTSLTCYGDTTMIEVYASGGTGGFEFHLYSATDTIRQDDSIFSPVSGGDYTVRILDTNTNCFVDTSISINQPNPIQITSLADTNFTCHNTNDGKIVVQANGGQGALTFSLFANDTLYDSTSTGIFINLPADTFTIRINDTLSCTSTDTSVIITNPDSLVIDSLTITPENCNTGGNDGTITFHASGGTPPYYYQILSPSFSEQKNDSVLGELKSDFYRIAVRDSNLCTSVAIDTFVGPYPIIIDSITLDPGILCHGEVTDLTIHASGGTGSFVYSVNSEIDTQLVSAFTNLPGGQYGIVVRDRNTRCSIDSVYVLFEPGELLISEVRDSGFTCNNDQNGRIHIFSTGGTNYVDYYLFNADVNPLIRDTLIQRNDGYFDSLLTGNYVFFIRDSAGCEKSGIDTVEIDNPARIIIDSLKAFDETCSGVSADGSIIVYAHGGDGSLEASVDLIQWFDNDSLQDTVKNLNKGIYNVSIRDVRGCVVDTSGISVGGPPEINITLYNVDSSKFFCYDDSATTIQLGAIGGSGTLEFSINGTDWQENGRFENVPAGTYPLLVRDSFCTKPIDTLVLKGPDAVKAIVDNIIYNSAEDVDDGAIEISGEGGTPFTSGYNYSLRPFTDTLPGDSASIIGYAYRDTGYFFQLPGEVNYTPVAIDSFGCIGIGDPIYLSALTLISSADSVNCNGGNDGSIQLQILGGSGDYAIQWSESVNDDLNPTGLSAGEYIVTIFDSVKDITRIDTIEVGEPEPIQIFESLNHISCFGFADGSIVVDSVTGGNGGYSFKWTQIQTDLILNDTNIFNLERGTYKLLVTDNKNCKDSIIDSISEPQSLFIADSLVNAITCFDSADGEIWVQVNGGNNLYSFILTDPQAQSDTSNSISEDSTVIYFNLNKGNYTFTASDSNGCVMPPASFSITEPTQMIISTTFINPVKCYGDSTGSIDLRVEGGTGSQRTIIWSSLEDTNFVRLDFNDPDLDNIPSGNYISEIRDENGCILTDIFNVSQPDTSVYIASFSIETPVCIENVLQGTDIGLISIDEVKGGTTGAEGVYEYQWNTGSTANRIENISGGEYTLRISDDNNCTFDTLFILQSSQDNFISIDTVRVFESSSINILEPEEIRNLIICEGNSVDLVGQLNIESTSLTEFYWYRNDSTGKDTLNDTTQTLSITPVDNDTFYFYVQNEKCWDEASVALDVRKKKGLEIWVEDEEGSLSNEYLQLLVKNDSVKALASPDTFLSYHWIPDVFINSDSLARISIHPESNVTYTLWAFDDNNCVEIDSVRIRVISDYTDAPSCFTPNGDGINDEWFLPNSDRLIDEVYIYNRWGILVFYSDSYEDNPFKGLNNNGKKLSFGTYYYVIKLKKGGILSTGLVTLIGGEFYE
ncbi:gliding motility-associated C-terminal domain-containing protein [Bacteroidota bacterium]